jgi:hypothetical protein
MIITFGAFDMLNNPSRQRVILLPIVRGSVLFWQVSIHHQQTFFPRVRHILNMSLSSFVPKTPAASFSPP